MATFSISKELVSHEKKYERSKKKPVWNNVCFLKLDEED